MIHTSYTHIAHKELLVNITVSAADFKQLVLKPYSEAWSWHTVSGWSWDLCHVGKYPFPDQSGIKSQLIKYTLKSNTHSDTYISQNHRITEWYGLDGTSVGHLVQPPCRSRVTYSRL